jgi:glucose-6-phosphate 1-dehydrogenase
MPDDQPIGTPASPPTADALPRPRPVAAGPCAMVIFGASGDLTKRLIIPALYNLSRTGVLPSNFALVGVAQTEGTTESWRAELHDALTSYVGAAAAGEFAPDHIDEAAWERLARTMSYLQGDVTRPESYTALGHALDEAEKTHATEGNAIFYLAVADRLFGTIVAGLATAKLSDQGGDHERAPGFWRRVVIEKPFGHDLASARQLNGQILRTLTEDQIFRIDHFLGKDTVQSIMAFRFANGLFEPIWNRDRIDHVQITAAETVGVEARGKFYEATGALRDMTPNHLLSLLAMVAMEPPVGFDAGAIRAKKAEVFAAMPSVAPEWAVRGQYGAGAVSGKAVKAGRGAGLQCRDLCRDAAYHRQLALGRRAILHPHWQAPVAAVDRDRHPLQAGAVCGVQRNAGGDAAAQLAGAAHRARRGDLAAVRGQAPRAGGRPRLSQDGLPLRRLVRQGAQRRLRDPVV